MYRINSNFKNISENYLFSDIANRVNSFQEKNPDVDLIRLGIGDVTLPLPSQVTESLIKASQEQAKASTFVGYGPEQGHKFLRELIALNDYASRGINIGIDEIFISDGAKSDIANIGDILSIDNVVAITDPVYPVYVDTNIISGREIQLLMCTEHTGFLPEIPTVRIPDIIYLCYPNNPTGVTMSKTQLKKWVDFALDSKALILFDSAYEAYISSPEVPHSIYEIEGAKKCAVEFRSYSKTAGFTGLRCGYTVVPKELECDGLRLNDLWRRRQSTKFNGASYVVQRAAAALYTDEGKRAIWSNIDYYKANASVLRNCFREAKLEVFGGIDAPYLWVKTPHRMNSWDFFDILLREAHIVATPGVGFGDCGEGYMRFTAFSSAEATDKAASKIIKLLK